MFTPNERKHIFNNLQKARREQAFIVRSLDHLDLVMSLMPDMEAENKLLRQTLVEIRAGTRQGEHWDNYAIYKLTYVLGEITQEEKDAINSGQTSELPWLKTNLS